MYKDIPKTMVLVKLSTFAVILTVISSVTSQRGGFWLADHCCQSELCPYNCERCDGKPDCYDLSDELGCSNETDRMLLSYEKPAVFMPFILNVIKAQLRRDKHNNRYRYNDRDCFRPLSKDLNKGLIQMNRRTTTEEPAWKMLLRKLENELASRRATTTTEVPVWKLLLNKLQNEPVTTPGFVLTTQRPWWNSTPKPISTAPWMKKVQPPTTADVTRKFIITQTPSWSNPWVVGMGKTNASVTTTSAPITSSTKAAIISTTTPTTASTDSESQTSALQEIQTDVPSTPDMFTYSSTGSTFDTTETSTSEVSQVAEVTTLTTTVSPVTHSMTKTTLSTPKPAITTESTTSSVTVSDTTTNNLLDTTQSQITVNETQTSEKIPAIPDISKSYIVQTSHAADATSETPANEVTTQSLTTQRSLPSSTDTTAVKSTAKTNATSTVTPVVEETKYITSETTTDDVSTPGFTTQSSEPPSADATTQKVATSTVISVAENTSNIVVSSVDLNTTAEMISNDTSDHIDNATDFITSSVNTVNMSRNETEFNNTKQFYTDNELNSTVTTDYNTSQFLITGDNTLSSATETPSNETTSKMINIEISLDGIIASLDGNTTIPESDTNVLNSTLSGDVSEQNGYGTSTTIDPWFMRVPEKIELDAPKPTPVKEDVELRNIKLADVNINGNVSSSYETTETFKTATFRRNITSTENQRESAPNNYEELSKVNDIISRIIQNKNASTEYNLFKSGSKENIYKTGQTKQDKVEVTDTATPSSVSIDTAFDKTGTVSDQISLYSVLLNQTAIHLVNKQRAASDPNNSYSLETANIPTVSTTSSTIATTASTTPQPTREISRVTSTATPVSYGQTAVETPVQKEPTFVEFTQGQTVTMTPSPWWRQVETPFTFDNLFGFTDSPAQNPNWWGTPTTQAFNWDSLFEPVLPTLAPSAYDSLFPPLNNISPDVGITTPPHLLLNTVSKQETRPPADDVIITKTLVVNIPNNPKPLQPVYTAPKPKTTTPATSTARTVANSTGIPIKLQDSMVYPTTRTFVRQASGLSNIAVYSNFQTKENSFKAGIDTTGNVNVDIDNVSNTKGDTNTAPDINANVYTASGVDVVVDTASNINTVVGTASDIKTDADAVSKIVGTSSNINNRVENVADSKANIKTASNIRVGLNTVSNINAGVNTASNNKIVVESMSDNKAGVGTASVKDVVAETVSDVNDGVGTVSVDDSVIETRSNVKTGIASVNDVVVETEPDIKGSVGTTSEKDVVVETATDMYGSAGTASVNDVVVEPASDNNTRVGTTSVNDVIVKTVSDINGGVGSASVNDFVVKTVSDIDGGVGTASVNDTVVKTVSGIDGSVGTASVNDIVVKTVSDIDGGVGTASVNDVVETASDINTGVGTASVNDVVVKTVSDIDGGVGTASVNDVVVETASDINTGVGTASVNDVVVKTVSDINTGVDTASVNDVVVKIVSDIKTGVGNAPVNDTVSDINADVYNASVSHTVVETTSDVKAGVETASNINTGADLAPDTYSGIDIASNNKVGSESELDMNADVAVLSNIITDETQSVLLPKKDTVSTISTLERAEVSTQSDIEIASDQPVQEITAPTENTTPAMDVSTEPQQQVIKSVTDILISTQEVANETSNGSLSEATQANITMDISVESDFENISTSFSNNLTSTSGSGSLSTTLSTELPLIPESVDQAGNKNATVTDLQTERFTADVASNVSELFENITKSADAMAVGGTNETQSYETIQSVTVGNRQTVEVTENTLIANPSTWSVESKRVESSLVTDSKLTIHPTSKMLIPATSQPSVDKTTTTISPLVQTTHRIESAAAKVNWWDRPFKSTTYFSEKRKIGLQNLTPAPPDNIADGINGKKENITYVGTTVSWLDGANRVLSTDKIASWWHTVHASVTEPTILGTDIPVAIDIQPTTTTAGDLQQCNRREDTAGFCQTRAGHFKNPADCRTFFVCIWGILHECRCPPNTLFDEKIQVCNWDYMVTC